MNYIGIFILTYLRDHLAHQVLCMDMVLRYRLGLCYILVVLAHMDVLEHVQVLVLEHNKEQLSEQELGRRKQFLRIRPRIHFLNEHRPYCISKQLDGKRAN